MAINSTVFKIELDIGDEDRGYYESHALTIARHPSENDTRLAARLVAFALEAAPPLEFGRGLSSDDEPALWTRGLTGEILRWIDVGEPNLRRVRSACGRADSVAVYCYGGRKAEAWWNADRAAFESLSNLDVVSIDAEGLAALAGLLERRTALYCSISHGVTSFVRGNESVAVALNRLLTPRNLEHRTMP